MGVEQTSAGLAEQTTHVGLSDGSSLKLTLSFSEHWPVLYSVYCDPLLAETPAPENAPETKQVSPSVPTDEREQRSWFTASLGALSSFARSLFDKDFWLRSAAVTALIAVLLASAVLMLRMRSGPAISAASLLQQSAAAEQAVATRADQVLHRTINLEERVTEPRADRAPHE